MATSEISVTKIVSSREETRPNVHLRVEVETETGPLVIKLSPAAAHQLQDILKKLPPNILFQSPPKKI